MNKKFIATIYQILFFVTIICSGIILFFSIKMKEYSYFLWLPFIVFMLWSFIINNTFLSLTKIIKQNRSWYKILLPSLIIILFLLIYFFNINSFNRAVETPVTHEIGEHIKYYSHDKMDSLVLANYITNNKDSLTFLGFWFGMDEELYTNRLLELKKNGKLVKVFNPWESIDTTHFYAYNLFDSYFSIKPLFIEEKLTKISLIYNNHDLQVVNKEIPKFIKTLGNITKQRDSIISLYQSKYNFTFHVKYDGYRYTNVHYKDDILLFINGNIGIKLVYNVVSLKYIEYFSVKSQVKDISLKKEQKLELKDEYNKKKQKYFEDV